MKKLIQYFCVALVLSSVCLKAMAGKSDKQQQRIVVAYVCSWTDLRLPDPTLMTHINYAFGHVKNTFDGCDVQNPPFLRQVVALKEKNPSLKIQLSVGGWTSGNFSEMAADPQKRMSFAKDCARIVKEYGLDGIDIDWEYPTSSAAGISSSPDDTRNFTLLMRDLRKTLGKNKLLTAATVADGKYIDFRSCLKYMDFVNIMAYDTANPPRHHTTLVRSSLSGRLTVEESIDAHIAAGVPPEKLTLGMPLYGRGAGSDKVLQKYVKTQNDGGKFLYQWDPVGKVPYLTDKTGRLVLAFDNAESLAAKCQMIIDRGLLGGMYWECTEDNAQLDEMKTIYLSLLANGKASVPKKQVLVVTDNPDDQMTRGAIRLLKMKGDQMGFEVSELSSPNDYKEGLFAKHHLVVNLLSDINKLNETAKTELNKYVQTGQGSYLSYFEVKPLPTPPFRGRPREEKKTTGWEWYDNLCENLSVPSIEGSSLKIDGVTTQYLWTNNEQLGRTLFVCWNEQLPRPEREEAATMFENALNWLLHNH